ncbi:hypothetical protein HDV00_003740 [Rhizophlyctis rosea]|nr:hypothetical protein HDV00_003740 [Rhizophlyctis rosea]
MSLTLAASSTASATEALLQSARIYNRDSRTATRAARAYESLASSAQATGDYSRALEYYNLARDAFDREGDGRAKTILSNIADVSIHLKHYSEARKHYETLASESIDSSTLRFSVPKYLLNAVLCTIAEGDWVKAKTVLQGYGDKYPVFGSSLEAAALKDFISEYETFDLESCQKAYQQLNKVMMTQSD